MLIEKTSEYVCIPYYMCPQSDEVKPNQDDVDFGDDDFVIDRGHGTEEPASKRSKIEEEEEEQEKEEEEKKGQEEEEEEEGQEE